MIRRIGIELYFPGDPIPVDVSHLYREGSGYLSLRAFNESKYSVCNTFSFSIKHDQTIIDKVRSATGKIGIAVTNQTDSSALFTGVIEPSAQQSTHQVVEDLKLEAVDMSYLLDEKIGTAFEYPETIGADPYKVCDPADVSNSIFHQVCFEAGYLITQINPTIANLSTVLHCASNTGSETYREFLDGLLFEYGLVVDTDAEGKLITRRWIDNANNYTDTVSSDLSVVEPLTWERRYIKEDGVTVEWSETAVLEDALLYRDSLPISNDGVFTGKSIAAGDYYPPDSDIEDTFQDYVEKWLDKPYLERSTRIKNRDISLITTDSHTAQFDADDGVQIENEQYESHRAKINFQNVAAETKKIYTFEITGRALYRSAVKKTIVPETAKNTDTITTRFIFNSTAAVAFANALALDMLQGDFEYSFGVNRLIEPGTTVRLINAKNNIDTTVIIQNVDFTIGRPIYRYRGIAVAEHADLPSTTTTSGGQILWPYLQDLQSQINARPTNEEIEAAPADVLSVFAVAYRDYVRIQFDLPESENISNGVVGVILQRSKDGTYWYDVNGVNGGLTRVSGSFYDWEFNRDVDGYPNDLSSWNYRIKYVNAAGTASINWTYTGAPNVSQYLGWTPGTPSLYAKAAGRNVSLTFNKAVAPGYYGHSGFHIQIKRSDETEWYEPGDSGAAYDSESAYKTGAVDGYGSTPFDAFAQTVPFINQAAGIPQDTTYHYRIRAVVSVPTSADPDAEILSDWSSAVAVVAKVTGIRDVAEKAIRTAQLDDSAVTLDKLNVLSKNLVNSFINPDDGLTGWSVGTGRERGVDENGIPYYQVTAPNHGFNSVHFEVKPDDILEFTFGLQVPNYTTLSGIFIGLKRDWVQNYDVYSFNFTTKSWVFSNNTINAYFIGDYKSLNTQWFKTYILGSNVNIEDVPAPSRDSGFTGAISCIRLMSGDTKTHIRNGYNDVLAGTIFRLYCPQVRSIGGGRIVAQQVIVDKLSAISSKLGEIQGDTENYKLVMGSGGSAEEGTLLLGATTDESFLRRWKEGGIWKMAIKLATFFVDAVSSKILGVFQVRNASDSATALEVDPSGEISANVPLRREPNFITTSTGTSYAAYKTKIARITLTAQYQDALFRVLISGNNYAKEQYVHIEAFFRVKQQAAFGSDPIIETMEIHYSDISTFRLYYHIVQNSGPTIVDVYAAMALAYCQLRGTAVLEAYKERIKWLSNQSFVADVTGAVGFNLYRDITEKDGDTELTHAHVYDLDIQHLGTAPAGNVEYRWIVPATTIDSTECFEASVIEQQDGGFRVVYRSLGSGIKQRIAPLGGNWGSAITIVSEESLYPCIIQKQDGEYLLVYIDAPSNIKKMTTSSGTWGSAVILCTGTKPKIVQRKNGDYVLFYIRLSDSALVYRTIIDDVLGTETPLETNAVVKYSAIEQADGNLRVVYVLTSSKDIKDTVCVNGSWSFPGTIVSATSTNGLSIVQQLDGDFRLVYVDSTKALKEKKCISNVWKAAEETLHSQAQDPCIIQRSTVNKDFLVVFNEAPYSDYRLLYRMTTLNSESTQALIGGGFTSYGVDSLGPFFQTWNNYKLRPTQNQINFSTLPSPGAGIQWPDNPSGTFTPELRYDGVVPNCVYSLQEGQYTRIGNIVFIRIRIKIISNGSTGNNGSIITVVGIPFASASPQLLQFIYYRENTSSTLYYNHHAVVDESIIQLLQIDTTNDMHMQIPVKRIDISAGSSTSKIFEISGFYFI